MPPIPPDDDASPDRRSLRRGRAALLSLQRRVAAALGISMRGRTGTVVAMLRNNARRAPGYWIQLALAMGIATLGLVLGSTAVVIGAMLVSPLMGPIVELGMGFAVGSSLLVIRATLRVLASVATVIAGSAAITLLLPFHEVTAEIAARTVPTALDLLVAVLCALTAAYTVVRATSDTTSAAAGTAIGIALVPPLCVVGYGLGTGSATVAGGAALLFTANFSAIVVFSTLAFLLLGYGVVDAARLEREHCADALHHVDGLAARLHARLGGAFGARYGLAMRLLAPALFLVAVYVPLGRALDEVAWQVRARTAIRRVLAEEAPRSVQVSVTAESRAVALRLVVLGSLERAATLERTLVRRIVEETGVADPDVDVIAVPDAAAFAAATSGTIPDAARDSAPPAPTLRARLDTALARHWPAAVAGPVVSWEATIGAGEAIALTVHHLGTPTGAAADSVLAGVLATAAGAPLRLVPVALPGGVLRLPAGASVSRTRAWLDSARARLRSAEAVPGLVACLGTPPLARAPAERRRDAATRATLAAMPMAASRRLVVDTASTWSLRLARERCAGRAGASEDNQPPGASRAASASSAARASAPSGSAPSASISGSSRR